jgi:hypothetical protein
VIDELNPNHHVTSAIHDHWHKVVAVLLHKYANVLGREVRIYPSDLEAMEREEGGVNVVIEDRDGAIRLRLVTDAEGAQLARKAGGLPS